MKRIISTKNAPAAIGPYSQAIEINGTLYISGQIPVDPSTGKVVDGGIEEQTEQVMKNIGAILKEAGYEYQHIVKTTCLLADMGLFKSFNEIYGGYFPENPPARATFAVRELPMGVLVEVEAVAVSLHISCMP